MDTGEIREIARKYTPEQIEQCITTQLETGRNVCVRNASTDVIINRLSKASFVRELTDRGMSLADALRELAERIRVLRKGYRE